MNKPTRFRGKENRRFWKVQKMLARQGRTHWVKLGKNHVAQLQVGIFGVTHSMIFSWPIRVPRD